MSNTTFTMIKPDAIEANNHCFILEKILASGFKIIAMKMVLLSGYQAKKFYKIHEGKPFFEELIDFITRGPVIVAVLNKKNAVEDFRNLNSSGTSSTGGSSSGGGASGGSSGGY